MLFNNQARHTLIKYGYYCDRVHLDLEDYYYITGIMKKNKCREWRYLS